MSKLWSWIEPPLLTGQALLRLTLFGFLMATVGNWILPLIDRDEPRFAEATREMIERNDYLVPHFNGDFRFDKPPLIYWMQVPFVRLLGANEFAVRLPSSICATLTGLLIFGFGLRLFDRRTAWFAALMFLTCLQTLIHARAAVADFAMVLFVTAAFWAGWEMLRPGARPFWRWIFYPALGLGFLAKGPIAWLPLGVLGWCHWKLKKGPHSSRQSPKIGWIFGLLLMLAIVAAWGIPALAATDGEFYRVGIGKHVIERSVSAMEGHGSKNLWMYLLFLPFYFVLVFFSFFPWCLKLPSMIRGLRGGAWKEPRLQYLVLGTVLTFGIFTLVKTKLPHYTLPAFPLLALLLAHHLCRENIWKTQRAFLQKGLAGMVVLNVLLALVVFPLMAPLFPAKKLWLASRADLKPEMEFASKVFNEPSLVWYFRNDVQGFHRLLKKDFMDLPGPRFCVFPKEELEKFFPTGTGDFLVHQVEGFNFAKGKPIQLMLVIKQE